MQCFNRFQSSGYLNDNSLENKVRMARQPQELSYTDQQFMGSNIADESAFIELRKKLHLLKQENFSLRQELSHQRTCFLQLEQANNLLKKQLEQSLGQLSFSDTQIQKLKHQLNDSLKYGSFLEQKVQNLQTKLASIQQTISQQNQLISRQTQHISNLNQENLLLIELKKVLATENTALKNSYEQISNKYLLKENQIHQLKIEIEYLIKDLANLQDLLRNQNQQILTYERFLTNKDQQIQDSKLNEVQILLRDEKFLKKIDKYKKKALKYKIQRDQLLQEIQEAKKQIGTITLRKYLDSDDTMENNYSFEKQVCSN